MPYLRKPLQGPYDVILPKNDSVVVGLATQLDSPGEAEFWEIGLVTGRIGMGLSSPTGAANTSNDNNTFIGDASIVSPPTADIRMVIRTGEFLFIAESLANNYNDGFYGMIANLSSPIVISPSERVDIDLIFVSHASSVLASDAPGPLHLQGTFSVLLAGTVEQED